MILAEYQLAFEILFLYVVTDSSYEIYRRDRMVTVRTNTVTHTKWTLLFTVMYIGSSKLRHQVRKPAYILKYTHIHRYYHHRKLLCVLKEYTGPF